MQSSQRMQRALSLEQRAVSDELWALSNFEATFGSLLTAHSSLKASFPNDFPLSWNLSTYLYCYFEAFVILLRSCRNTITRLSKYHYEAFEILLRNFRKIFEMAFAVIFSRVFVSIARISKTEKHVSLFPILTHISPSKRMKTQKKPRQSFSWIIFN